MIIIRLFGIILIIVGIYFFKTGLKYNDKLGYNLMNIKIVGVSILLFIGGLTLLFTSKSLCDILGIIC